MTTKVPMTEGGTNNTDASGSEALRSREAALLARLQALPSLVVAYSGVIILFGRGFTTSSGTLLGDLIVGLSALLLGELLQLGEQLGQPGGGLRVVRAFAVTCQRRRHLAQRRRRVRHAVRRLCHGPRIARLAGGLRHALLRLRHRALRSL